MAKVSEFTSITSADLDDLIPILDVSDTSMAPSGTNKNISVADLSLEALMIAVSDEATAITTGTAKVTFRMPFAMTLSDVRASLAVASSSGAPTVDINEGGVSILSTKLTIDASEKTSVTAAVPVVISDSVLADDAEITIDIDVAGTEAKGLKVALIGRRASDVGFVESVPVCIVLSVGSFSWFMD